MDRERIAKRLNDLGLSEFDAAEKIGRHRNFIYDFMTGRKKSFKGDGPEQVARALDCSVEYLNGETDLIGNSGPIDPGSPLAIDGVAEVGAWRSSPPLSLKRPIRVSIPRDQRYLDCRHVAFMVKGDGHQAFGIEDGMVVVGIDVDDFRQSTGKDIAPGTLAVVERTRVAGSASIKETSIRKISRVIKGRQAVVEVPEELPDEAIILAIVGISFTLY